MASYRPEYINQLLMELNSLVANPSHPVISGSKGLGVGNKDSCGLKNFCGHKRLSKSLVEEGVFQWDSPDPMSLTKPSLSITESLDDNAGVTANIILKQVQKKQQLQE